MVCADSGRDHAHAGRCCFQPFVPGGANVHPLAIVIAIIAGSLNMGLWGMSFAIPPVVIVKTAVATFFKELNRTSDMCSQCVQKELCTRGIVLSLARAQGHTGCYCRFTECVGPKIKIMKRHFSHSRTTVTYGMRIGLMSTHASTFLKSFAASCRYCCSVRIFRPRS